MPEEILAAQAGSNARKRRCAGPNGSRSAGAAWMRKQPRGSGRTVWAGSSVGVQQAAKHAELLRDQAGLNDSPQGEILGALAKNIRESGWSKRSKAREAIPGAGATAQCRAESKPQRESAAAAA
jgi:hypothetical protein